MGYDMYRLLPNGKPVEVTSDIFGTDDYYRLTVWGMQEVRSHLEQVGIVKDGDFPAPPKEEEDVEVWRRASPGDGPGIPIHKLCSNDGWIINPVEVSSGIKYADEHHPRWRKRISKQSLEFVEWMEHSADGFEVW